MRVYRHKEHSDSEQQFLSQTVLSHVGFEYTTLGEVGSGDATAQTSSNVQKDKKILNSVLYLII